MIHRLLFETRIGAWFLALMERHLGLALVDARTLGEERVFVHVIE